MSEKILLLSGGDSAEREISLRSGDAVEQALIALGLAYQRIDPRDTNVAQIDASEFSLAFIALHGRGGEDGVIQGVLEYIGLPYTGSGVQGSSLAMDKLVSKKIFRSSDIATANFHVAYKDDDINEQRAEFWLQELGGKCVLKPVCEGSSIGMAIVSGAAQLIEKLQLAFQYDNTVLLEQHLAGQEYTVAILGEKALAPIKLLVEGEFYDFEAKYQSNTTQYLIPAGLSSQREHEIQSLALKAFQSVGAKGWGRVDIMCDANDQYQVLEINTVPGMTEHSLVPKAAAAEGIEFNDLIARIIRLARVQAGAQ